MQASAGGLKKDVLLGKVASLLSEKQQWIENQLHKISDLMKKAVKMPEVRFCWWIFKLLCTAQFLHYRLKVVEVMGSDAVIIYEQPLLHIFEKKENWADVYFKHM